MKQTSTRGRDFDLFPMVWYDASPDRQTFSGSGCTIGVIERAQVFADWHAAQLHTNNHGQLTRRCAWDNRRCSKKNYMGSRRVTARTSQSHYLDQPHACGWIEKKVKWPDVRWGSFGWWCVLFDLYLFFFGDKTRCEYTLTLEYFETIFSIPAILYGRRTLLFTFSTIVVTLALCPVIFACGEPIDDAPAIQKLAQTRIRHKIKWHRASDLQSFGPLEPRFLTEERKPSLSLSS